jgi:hypothetical protein
MAKKKTTKTVTTQSKGKGKVVTTTTVTEEFVDEKKLTNHVAILVDTSGSMDNCWTGAREAVLSNIRTLKERARESGQRTTLSLYSFGLIGGAKCHFRCLPVETINGIPGELAPYGRTPLLDCLGIAISDLSALSNAKDLDTSFLMMMVTDGGENSSHMFTSAGVQTMMREMQATDRWTFSFLLPSQSALRNFVSGYAVPEGNCKVWTATDAGARIAAIETNAGIADFYSSRKLGMRSVQHFYTTTDLSKVKAADVKKLDDLSDRFKLHNVKAETNVKAFCEEKTKRQYVIGQGYYLLMKREKIQPQKQVLLMEKGKLAVWGGTQARALLGLPAGEHATVTPGNHANYDIFVQSASVNRILPRGTKVLIDSQLSSGIKPTWDHTAVENAGAPR